MVLVTGSNGFVGRALSRRALADGWRVRGTVRQWPVSFGLGSLAEEAPVETIGPATDWSTILRGIEVVVHLAARVHVMQDTEADPLTAFRQVNVAGTERLARQAAACGVRRFVFISSIKVNGEGAERPYNEESVAAPQDPYGQSKWEAEMALSRVAAETGLEVVILRPPLIYGPGVKANFLRLLSWVDRGFPLPLGAINNRRSLLYLENLVDAIIACLRHPSAAGQTFFVSDASDFSTPELIKKIAAAMNRPARLIPFPGGLLRLLGGAVGKGAEIDRLVGSLQVDSSKIRRMLDWTPPFSAEEGFKETAKWYLSQR